MSLSFSFIFRFISYTLVATWLIGCGGGGGNSSSGGTTSTIVSCGLSTTQLSNTEVKSNTLLPNAPFTISGAVIPAIGSRVDIDTNDPLMGSTENNDNFATAQLIPNFATIGGYLSVSNGDTDDYYSVNANAGQVIALSVPDATSFMLSLYDKSQNQLSETPVDSNGVASVTIPGSFAGTEQFFIRVNTVSEASIYNLRFNLAATELAFPELKNDFVPGEIIIELKDDSDKQLRFLSEGAPYLNMQLKAGAPSRSMLMQIARPKKLGITRQSSNSSGNSQSNIEETQLKIDTILTKRALQKRADVKSARLNYYVYASATPNDEFYSSQWHYEMINLPQAWDISKGSNTVTVAVIDTGVLREHPDLRYKLVNGYDFIRDITSANDDECISGLPGGIDTNPNDPGDRIFLNSSSFHGTHIAGTVAAQTHNASGVAGAGWNVNVMPLRVLGLGGAGTSYDIEQAVRYAAGLSNDSGVILSSSEKADVINLSLGGRVSSMATPSAFKEARDAGVIIFAAAGNDSSTSGFYYPASFDDAVFAVGAVNSVKTKAFYSNTGAYLDVVAPGGDTTQNLNGDDFPDGVFSTLGSDIDPPIVYGYGIKQGTSMATAHVSGVAALMKSIRPSLNFSEFNAALSSGVLTEDLGTSGRDDTYGYGLIDALASVVEMQRLNTGGVSSLPYLLVSPGSLNFGTGLTSLTLTLSNRGTDPLRIDSVNNNSGGWLTYTSSGGLGDYVFSVDRDLLTEDKTYEATVTIESSVNTVTIPVYVVKDSSSNIDDAGTQYILLVQVSDSGGLTVIDQRPVSVISGRYSFSFSNILAGNYRIFSGSDLDNDGIICDVGESCGIFPETGVYTLNNDFSNANFTTRFDFGVSTTSLSSEMLATEIPVLEVKRLVH